MIKIENTDVYGWGAAIRGMRNAMNSWDKSDSCFLGVGDRGCCDYCLNPMEEDKCYYDGYYIGNNDLDLMGKLVAAGDDHSKFMRFVWASFDVVAPLYWWKEFETYRVGVAPCPTDIEMNSCSTMHRIHAKPFELKDFAHDHLCDAGLVWLELTIEHLNYWREMYLEHKEKWMWWQMIQLLPSSYMQRRTLQCNYAALRHMYNARRNHKLDEWRELCKWIETLPYSKLITKEG